MKKNALALVTLILVLCSCKKSTDGTSNTLLLAEVYNNGYLEEDYQYSLDKLLLRHNAYTVGAGQPIPLLYVLYEYGTDGQIAKRKVFSKDTLNNYHILSHNNAGLLTRADWYLPGGTLYEYRVYEYDPQNRVTKYTVKNGGSNATKSYVEFTYDSEGRLDLQRTYAWDTDKFRMSNETDYLPAGKHVYKHWQKFMIYPSDMQTAELTAESAHVRYFDDNGNVSSEYTETASAREYNNAGYLLKQTLTRVYIKPVNPGTVSNMEYNYVK